MNHPEAATWMAFLYGELSAAKNRELNAHLAHCPACAAQLKAWRGSMTALDGWTLPARRPTRPFVLPVLKWAAAAALVLAFGVILGRQTSSHAAELASLKTSVAELTRLVQRENAATLTNSVAAATTAANEQTLRLLANYSRLQEEQRNAERETVALALRALDTRVNRVRGELETVAVNTETGLERVAMLSVPSSQE